MLIQTLKTLFNRDLEKLSQEINAYKNEKNIWLTEDGISNSAGNLCLHLLGNLNTYIGAEIGKTGYIRNRDLEFSMKDVTRQELLEGITKVKEIVQRSLDLMKDNELEQEYSLLVFKEKTSTGYFLVHLAVHLGYHLGQVNYHRRMLDK
jgi:uncharacterized damage-inducible protein DinB